MSLSGRGDASSLVLTQTPPLSTRYGEVWIMDGYRSIHKRSVSFEHNMGPSKEQRTGSVYFSCILSLSLSVLQPFHFSFIVRSVACAYAGACACACVCVCVWLLHGERGVLHGVLHDVLGVLASLHCVLLSGRQV